MKSTKEVLLDVEQERINQIAKNYEHLSVISDFIVLSEEVGEVAQALRACQTWLKSSDKNDLYRELVQVAAVAVKMAEKVKRHS